MRQIGADNRDAAPLPRDPLTRADQDTRRRVGSAARTRRANAGSFTRERESENSSESGVDPLASTAVRSPVVTSSTAPRAIVRGRDSVAA